jgi:hypothetical protein
MTEEQLATAGGPQDPPLVYEDADVSLVKIYHSELDAYGEAPRAGVRFLTGWEVVDPTPAEAATQTSYDPSGHSVSEVLEQLDRSGESEKAAILALERAGKARVSVLRAHDAEETNAPTDEGSSGA